MTTAESPPALADLHAQLVARMHEAVIVADCGGRIQLWNEGAERLFGYSMDEALGAHLDLIIPERFRAAHDQGFRRAIASGELRMAGRVLTTRSSTKAGERLYVDFSFGLLRDAGGQVAGVFAVGRAAEPPAPRARGIQSGTGMVGT